MGCEIESGKRTGANATVQGGERDITRVLCQGIRTRQLDLRFGSGNLHQDMLAVEVVCIGGCAWVHLLEGTAVHLQMM